MVEIRKSYLSLIWRAIWGIILLEIPLFMLWAQIGARHYSYDKENLYIKEGVFNKKSTSIPLYKIENVTSNANILGNGTMHVNSNVSGANVLMLTYINSVASQTQKLIEVVEKAKVAKGFKSVDTF